MEKHTSVLKYETIDALEIKASGTYYDATYGAGGHSLAILKKSPHLLISTDKDPRVKPFDPSTEHFQFVPLDFVLFLESPIYQDIMFDGILADFGVSSMQLDEGERGFSFMNNGPLDMRMNPLQEKSALTIVNEYSEEELANVIYQYGEERKSYRIARAIMRNRPLKTTDDLVNAILRVKHRKRGKAHPATKTFQAIRIEVNDELRKIEQFIDLAIKRLKPNGKLVVISFHSLEDRIVKQRFLYHEKTCICPPRMPCHCNKISLGKVITRKPVIPQEDELGINPRSRSAKMRVFQRLLM